MLFGRSRNLVGLDIGDSSIKVVELSELGKGRGWQLHKLGWEPLSSEAIVDGQITGGVAQGIAQVLFERHAYDGSGQLLTSSLTDYLVPSAADLPTIDIDHMELEDPDGELDARGVGEGGMIGAPAALCNAVSDALAPFGVEVEEQYLSPENVLRMIGRV